MDAASVARVRVAAMELCHARSMNGGVGAEEVVDKSARDCVAVDLLAPGLWQELASPLLALVHRLDRLRIELASASGRSILDIAELQLLLYPVGGHYRRHVDTGRSAKRAVRRSISLVLYLTEPGWDDATDGGQLRIFADGGIDAPPDRGAASEPDETATFEIAPAPGTLVLFDSLSVPHCVLPTQRPRLALAGWFCEQ